MKKYRINLPIIIEHVPYHEQFKKQLLSLIAQSDGQDVNSNIEQISRSDYFIKNANNLYAPLFISMTSSLLKKMTKEFIYDLNEEFSGFIAGMWFQQYKKTDTHGWHDHLKTHGPVLSVVYYLELPKGSPGTEFMDPYTKRYHRPKVKEGDLIMFPSFVAHRSSPNQSNDCKTIISANIE